MLVGRPSGSDKYCLLCNVALPATKQCRLRPLLRPRPRKI